MAYTTPPTAVSLTTATAADFNILGEDIEFLYGRSQGTTFTGATVNRTAGTSIATSTDSTITWTAEGYDYGGWFTSGTDIVVPAGAIPPGFTSIMVIVKVRTKFASNSTGNRAIKILLNGSAILAPTIPAVNGDTTYLDSIEWVEVEAADTLSMQVWQNSGGSLNVSDSSLTVLRFAPVS